MSATTTDAWSALADPTRRHVFSRVVAGEASVTEIAHGLPVSRPAVSQHLRVLLDARLVEVRRRGRQQLYRPRPDGLEELRQELDSYWTRTLSTCKELAEHAYQSKTSAPEEGTSS